jgi:hypothetical protein
MAAQTENTHDEFGCRECGWLIFSFPAGSAAWAGHLTVRNFKTLCENDPIRTRDRRALHARKIVVHCVRNMCCKNYVRSPTLQQVFNALDVETC